MLSPEDNEKLEKIKWNRDLGHSFWKTEDIDFLLRLVGDLREAEHKS